MRKLIFTDLDGTLLDYKTYSYKKASKALSLIKKDKIPLIFCTSKTKAEIEYYRKELDNKHPFISENGAAIFIPKKYFDFKFDFNKEDGKYYIIEFGTGIDKLKKSYFKIKKEIKLKSFLDMTAEKISKDADLSIEQARLAKRRNYSIPFKLLEDEKSDTLERLIRKYQQKFTIGGRYWHLIGNNNKGKAVKTLIQLYQKQLKNEKITTYAFGDSRNDFEMLESVDLGYLVKRHDNTYSSNEFKKTDGIGPSGFNREVLKMIK
ncbi:MAG: HAD-IIB family hydrolase [Candidatus Woesearchaeota archaeon]|jgi:mannosyl-3-phosphoglycerate phosphatase|nr:HAD-IIB family hydrolase [Candidatus Woesearchaeota archaeon]|tara:strand:+ start:7096 stop:7884 length:789 start_codon:yes stop_codon:yes gene_type:complete